MGLTEVLMSKSDSNDEGGKKGTWSEGLFSFFGAVVLILAFRWMVVEPYVIPSGSMIPSLLVYDHILVNKLAYGIRWPFTKNWIVRFDEPERGDVVVFKSVDDDGYFMVKRIVGLPGDELEYQSDGKLLVNGEELARTVIETEAMRTDQDPYYDVSEVDMGGEYDQFEVYAETNNGKTYRSMLMKNGYRWGDKPYKVPDGHIFMMGDNRDNSKDSRFWGPLPEENLLGKALFVWLSCEETLPFASFLCNPLKLRWGRFLHGVN
jgi:signal peptidase I